MCSGRLLIEARDVAIICARIAEEKRARDIVVLDIGKLFFLTDYFIIATGENRLQLRAIADDIEHQLAEAGAHRLGRSGYQDGRWILMDYADVIVHLFLPEARSYYDLELLWGDAPRVAWEAERSTTPPAQAEPLG